MANAFLFSNQKKKKKKKKKKMEKVYYQSLFINSFGATCTRRLEEEDVGDVSRNFIFSNIVG